MSNAFGFGGAGATVNVDSGTGSANQITFWTGTTTIGGSANLTYNSATGLLLQAQTGVFTNTQANYTTEFLVNGIIPLTEFQSEQGGSNFETAGLTAGVAVGSGSTVYQANGISGYINNASTTTNAVGGYFSGRALAASVKVWGANPVAVDGGFAATLVGCEVDTNVGNVGTSGNGILVAGAFSAQPGTFNAIHVLKPSGTGVYTEGLKFDASSVSGLYIDAPGAAAVNSLSVGLTSAAADTAQFHTGANQNLLVRAGLNILGGASGIGLQSVNDAVNSVQQLVIAGSPITLAIGNTVPGTAGSLTMGSNALPWASVYVGGAATNNIQITGTTTAARTATYPDFTLTHIGQVASTLAKTETGADASVLSYTPPAVAGSYMLNIAIDVSAANTATLGWTATWTNSKGNANAPTNLALFQMGVAAPALTFTAAANNSYYASVPISINNAGTAIVIKTTFSGTSIAYNATAWVERIA